MSFDQPRASLVKYCSPNDNGVTSALAANSLQQQVNATTDLPSSVKSKPKSDDILKSVLRPREYIQYEDDGQPHLYVQEVDSSPATRLDVIQLQESLDVRLMERQARESGICPVREELYGQAFDELIRQVTINSPERGVLLLRVRDEIRMTIAAYNTLFQSSVTFGTRKQLEAEQGKVATQQKISALRDENASLEAKKQELRNQYESIQRRQEEARAINQKKQKEEIEFQKYQLSHLESFIKSVDH